MTETAAASPSSGGRTGLPARWLGAAGLRPRAFREVAADPRALVQALLVVGAGGIGRGVSAFAAEGWLGLVGGTAVGLLAWIVAAVLVWWVGVQWLEHASAFPELLRTLGFAAAPLVALALCGVLTPVAARLWWVAVHVWATLAFAVAVREALGVSTQRALWICAGALGGALLLLLCAAAFLFDAMYID